MNTNLYGLLSQFSNGTKPCRAHLLRKFSSELVEEAIRKAYITPCGQNQDGDTLYTLTAEGKHVRDD